MEGIRIYGVSVACETTISKKEDDLTLGVIIVKSPSHTNLCQLRKIICEQLDNLPPKFRILTQKGWEIKEEQEPSILLPAVATHGSAIRIVSVYDEPRIGIKHRCENNDTGTPLGFVFISYSSSLEQLRNTIKDQLGSLVFNTENRSYLFLDRNGWPINSDQEVRFKVIDLLSHQCVLVQIEGLMFKGLDHVDSYPAITSVSSNRSSSNLLNLNTNSREPPVLSRQPTFIYEKESPQLWTMKSEADESSMEPKQVLLSYVRNEASEHAGYLKQELTRLGYSVFLDVDEIKSGLDWQDSLNYAVAHCETFVPLVTPHYGETQWTNREVKMADVLGKFIMPISFLDHWPPRVLGIQFATTQFLPWKPQKVLDEQEKLGELDIRCWEMVYVKNVANQIAQRLKINTKEHSRDMKLLKKVQTLKSCPAQLPNGFEGLSQNREGRPLIVISVHPQQKIFAIDLKDMLEGKGYEVWCTIELEEDIDSESSDTQLFSQDSARGGLFVCSQESQMSSSSDSEKIMKNLKFQEKADAAGVILVVMSRAFAMSKTCKQQVFYCEHRKKIIPIKYENFCMPGWISMLIGTGILESVDVANYKDLLCERVENFLSSQTHEAEDRQMECHITRKARELRKQMPEAVFTYISGGTHFFHEDSSEICKFIGRYLAEQDDIQLATGGFQGVGETVALSYQTSKLEMGKPETIWHILPNRDPKERLKCKSQKEDGTFEKLGYGTTVFSGDSVRERETIVSRVFDICILVEGGPGAAHEAEQFAWNDHIVIPVKYTGGAAGGKFNVPDHIFEVPYRVSNEDWTKLQDSSSSPDQIGKSVSNIVKALKQKIMENKRATSQLVSLQSKMSWDSNDGIWSNESVNSLDDKLISNTTVQIKSASGKVALCRNVVGAEPVAKSHGIQTIAHENLPSISSKCLLKSDCDLKRKDTLVFTELKSKLCSTVLKEMDKKLNTQVGGKHDHHSVSWKSDISDNKGQKDSRSRKHKHHEINQNTQAGQNSINLTPSKSASETTNTNATSTRESDQKFSSKRRGEHHCKSRSSSSEGNVVVHGSPSKKTRQAFLLQNGDGDCSSVVTSVQGSRMPSKEREPKSSTSGLSTPSGKMRMQVQL